MTAPPPAIFDRAARRLRRDRIAGQVSPLDDHIAEMLAERIDAVVRPFERALVVNTGSGAVAAMLHVRGISVDATDHGAHFADLAGGVQVDEDRLNPASQYDLVVIPWGLDTVDDLPGALILARRALCPDGLFLACFPAAPSLPSLRHAASQADAATGKAVARLHPQIDVRAAGDLLVRAGFSLPVADAETLRLSYLSLDRLIDDLRAAGSTNVLATRHPLNRQWLDAARTAFATLAEADGRTRETVTLVTLTGWAPTN